MMLPRRRQHVTFFVAIIVLATSNVASPQVPKAEDISACNMDAQRAVRTGTASGDSPLPNAKDHSRAAEARSAGGGTKPDDPQLVGMDTEGAKDPAYQAAYRTCMRKAGF
jgi:hypothetical protein